MDTANQGNVFFICVLIGVLGGAIYDGCSLGVFKGKNKKKYDVFRLIADVIFFLAFAAFCTWTGNRLGLPNVREYYYVGYAIGLTLYLKTFHKAVAFLKNICYNVAKKAIKWLKRTKNFRMRKEKSL